MSAWTLLFDLSTYVMSVCLSEQESEGVREGVREGGREGGHAFVAYSAAVNSCAR